MSQALTPARIISPGRILQRELDARGWTEEDLAQMIAYSSHVIRAIINGYQSITPETAQQLAAGLGISAEFWLNLEANYRQHLARKSQAKPLINLPAPVPA